MNITAPWMIKEESPIKHYSRPNLTQTSITFFNNNLDSFSTNSRKAELEGGRNQKWNTILSILSKNSLNQPNPPKGKDMGDLEYVKTLNRFDCPITLSP